MLKIKKHSTTDMDALKKELDPIVKTSLYLNKTLMRKFKIKLTNEEKSMTSVIQGWVEEYVK